MRRKALDFGYLQSNRYATVNVNNGYVDIMPAVPGVIYVPTYDPLVVFARPARGLVAGGALRFGPGITIGGVVRPLGWTNPAFLWPSHSIVIDRPWERRWVGREVYLHPYARPWVRAAGPRVEHHEFRRHLPTTGQPLRITGENGATVRSTVILQKSYTPRIGTNTGSIAGLTHRPECGHHERHLPVDVQGPRAAELPRAMY